MRPATRIQHYLQFPENFMTTFKRIAFIGNSLPRRYGIATFTTDFEHAVAISRPDVETAIVAMTDNGHCYEYPSVVRMQVHDGLLEDYLRQPNS